MNFTALSCYLSMPFEKHTPNAKKINTPRLLFAGCGFGWLPRSGARRYTQVLETCHLVRDVGQVGRTAAVRPAALRSYKDVPNESIVQMANTG